MAKKRRKKSDKTKLKERGVEIAKKIAKHRDNYTCQRCGREKLVGISCQGSHVIAVSQDGRLAMDPLNIKTLCAQCHLWWHENPMDSREWFIEVFPNRWFDHLEPVRVVNRGLGTITLMELTQRVYELEDQLEEMGG